MLLGAPTGSGKTIAAEMAMLRVFHKYPASKVCRWEQEQAGEGQDAELLCLCSGGLHRPPEGAGQREGGGLEGQDGGEAGKEVRLKQWGQEAERHLQVQQHPPPLSVCRVVELTGDVTPDMRAIAQADLIVTTPEKWDGVSRSWQNRSYVQKVSILIIDEIHLLGKAAGGGALAAGRRTGPSLPSSPPPPPG